MPQIESAEEAHSVARLIQSGQLQGPTRDGAMQALRAFDAEQSAPAAQPSLAMAPVGGAEMLAKMVTGAVASIPAGVAYLGSAVGKAVGADVNPAEVMGRVQNTLTYQPQSESGKAGEEALENLARPVIQPVVKAADRIAKAVGRVSPMAETYLRAAPSALQAATGLVPGAALAKPALAGERELLSDARAMVRKSREPLRPAEDVLARMGRASPQSLGAAAASPSIAGATPELRQAVSRTAKKTGGVVNTDVLNRHLEADSLPVPMRLTEGQATQDPALLSHEMNLRGKHPQLATRFNEQNGQLIQNVQAIRDEIGPDVFSTNTAEHGDALIAAYRAKNDTAQVAISEKYETLRNAAGGSFPVDATALLTNATKELHKQLLFDHAPKAVMSTLARLSETGMTFENFEALRTNLARIQRSIAADGNEKAAAGVIREAMEQLPLGAGAAQLKPYADAARVAAREQFKALEADPAYKAAVNESVSPDRFVQRFVISAPRDEVALMKANLAHDPAATQTMGVVALDHLRASARIDADWNGNFTQAGFNKALQALSPKLKSLVAPKTAEQLEKLGNVARYTQFQPRGSFVNNSNTLVASAAEYGASTAEGLANVAAHGVPVGTWGRKMARHVSTNRKISRATAPGAGLERLQPAQQQIATKLTRERNAILDRER